MAGMARGMSRGELARRSGFHGETILYFEKSGVLPLPERTAGGHRRYDERHARILDLMANARGLGFTSKEVRTLLDLGAPTGAPCDDVRDLAAARLKLIRQKIADLQSLEAILEGTIGRCSGGATPACAIIDLIVGSDQRR